MRDTKNLERTIMKRAAVLAVLAAALLAAAGLPRMALGGLAGTAFGLASFHLLGAAVAAAVAAGPVRASSQVMLKYLARYALTALVLYGTLRLDIGLFLGTAAGMVVVRFIVLLTGIFGSL
ncbi:MAG: hypothetical protein QME92_05100 [Bacillota bacterium]|nr:hypothetical protein [Bacillota bacterium]